MLHLLLLALVRLAFAGAVAFPTPASFTSSDGVRLAAAWGAPAGAHSGVVLVPMAGHAKEDWESTGTALYRSGVAVVAVDLRGQGKSGGGPVTDADYPKMVADVTAAITFLQGKGVTRVVLVGAEVGGNLAVTVAADNAAVVGVAMLSPGQTFKGVSAVDPARRLGERPLLLVASDDDPYALLSAKALAATSARSELVQLSGAGRGTRMLTREPTLVGTLVGFVGRAVATTTAPNMSTGSTIRLQPVTLTPAAPVH